MQFVIGSICAGYYSSPAWFVLTITAQIILPFHPKIVTMLHISGFITKFFNKGVRCIMHHRFSVLALTMTFLAEFSARYTLCMIGHTICLMTSLDDIQRLTPSRSSLLDNGAILIIAHSFSVLALIMTIFAEFNARYMLCMIGHTICRMTSLDNDVRRLTPSRSFFGCSFLVAVEKHLEKHKLQLSVYLVFQV
jgi:hypothetical protein